MALLTMKRKDHFEPVALLTFRLPREWKAMISVLQQHQEILALFCSMFVAVLFLTSGVIKLADQKGVCGCGA